MGYILASLSKSSGTSVTLGFTAVGKGRTTSRCVRGRETGGWAQASLTSAGGTICPARLCPPSPLFPAVSQLLGCSEALSFWSFPLPFHLCLPQPASALHPTRRCSPGVLSCRQGKLSACVGSSTAMVWLCWRLLTVRYISANCKHPRETSSANQVPPRTNEEVLALSTAASSQLLQAPPLG